MCATVVSTLAATGPESSGRPDDSQRPATMHLLPAPGSPPGQPGKPHTDASTVTASHTTPKHQAKSRTERRICVAVNRAESTAHRAQYGSYGERIGDRNALRVGFRPGNLIGR